MTLRTPRVEAGQAAPQSADSGDHRIFGGYRDLGPYAAAFDEMFDRRGSVRAPYKGIYAELGPTGPEELSARAEALGRAFVDQGITFALSGQEERPFPLDLVPRVISAAEWAKLESGIAQRVVALERFLDDLRRSGDPARRSHPAPADHLV